MQYGSLPSLTVLEGFSLSLVLRHLSHTGATLDNPGYHVGATMGVLKVVQLFLFYSNMY